jgi:multidrug efflux pump subunit AcrB
MMQRMTARVPRRVVAIAAGAALCGAVAAWWLVARPKTERLRIVATVSAPGMKAAEADREIGATLEQAARKVQGAQIARVMSRWGEASLELTLAPGVPVDAAMRSLSDALRPAAWPSAARPPVVTQAPQRAGLHLVVEGKGYTLRDMRAAVEAVVAPALERIAGVASVEVCGPTGVVAVRVDPLRARGHAVDVARVVDALRATRAPFADMHAIEDVRVGEVAGAPVRVRDVAVVAIEERVGCDAFRGEQSTVSAFVRLRQGAHAARAIADARAALPRVDVPPGMHLVALDGAPAADVAPRDVLRARVQLPASMSREQTARVALGAGAAIAKTPDVADVLVEARGDLTAYVALLDRAKRAAPSLEANAAAIAQAIEQTVPAANVVMDDAGDRLRAARVRVLGDDLAVMRAVVQQAREALAGVPGVAGEIDDARTVVGVDVRVDAAALARNGVNEAAAEELVRVALDEPVGAMALPRGTTEVIVGLGPTRPRSLEAVREQALLTGTGESTIPLGQVATIALEEEPEAIVREDGRRCIGLTFGLGEKRDRVLRAAKDAFTKSAKLPAGVVLAWDDEEP